MADSRYLTVDELAELVRVSPNTIRAWRSQGKGPRATKISGRVIFARADVDSWLAESVDAQTTDR